jgi:hypothetical protein
MDRIYGSGTCKSCKKCEKCGATITVSGGGSGGSATKRPNVRGQKIKELMAKCKSEGKPITLGEASKRISSNK